VAQEVVSLLQGSLPLAIELKFNDECSEATVMGDPTRLHQLMMNLCTNAVHAMTQGGVLELNLACEVLGAARKVRTGEVSPGEYVKISVKDSGHGIAPEVIDRIFEPFFTTKPAGRGTGLGLALVHAVVSEHKGFIDVASELGKGTTFTAWIPRIFAEEGAGRGRAEDAHGRRARSSSQWTTSWTCCTRWRKCSRSWDTSRWASTTAATR
jgi:signal transduction histidine kinase